MAMSGNFDGKPVAETLAKRSNRPAESNTYRDQTVWTSGKNCVVQMGNFMLMGGAGRCEKMIDRALDPPPESANPDDLYGDVYMRTDLSGLRANGSDRLSPQENDVLGGLVDSLSGVTVRANVWDQVALSFEGNPKKPDELRQLASMARGAMSLVKNQLSDDDLKLQALADLSNVRSEDGLVKLDLALPADDLFDRLHLPCPGRETEDAGVR